MKTVIDLSNDQREGAQLAEAAGLRFVRIPLTTTSAPPAAVVVQFLKLVNDPANQPVYVHCQGGRHRTGIMTAVYRMTHDRGTPDRAFEEMVQYQFKKGFVSHNTLEEFVYDFATRMTNPAAALASAIGQEGIDRR